MTSETPPNNRHWTRTKWVVVTIISAIIGMMVFYLWEKIAEWIWFDRGSVTLQFQATDGCPSGRVRNLLKGYETAPMNGAENLIICDTDDLTSTEADQFKDLAAVFKGCLTYKPFDRPELWLLRTSDAVCSLPGRSNFVCDGRSARGVTGGEGATFTPPDCEAETLKRFGFSE
jgi:hypothetical protein